MLGLQRDPHGPNGRPSKWSAVYSWSPGSLVRTVSTRPDAASYSSAATPSSPSARSSSTKFWSYPEPTARISRKSNRPPATGANAPVGTDAASTGVMRSAAIRNCCPSALPLSAPARFQYRWLVGFSTVGASVTAR